MINAIAMAMLFSTVGLLMILPPQPILVMSSSNDESMLNLAEEFVKDTPSKVEDTLVDTKDALAKGVEIVSKPIEKSMGWFRRKPKLEDQLKIAKENFDVGEDSMNGANIELKDKTIEKLNLDSQSIKDKTNGISHEYIGDKPFQIDGAIKSATNKVDGYKMEFVLPKIEQTTQDVAKDAHISIGETLESTNEETIEKIRGPQNSIHDGVEHITKKLQDVVTSIKDKAYDVNVKTKDITSNIVEFPKDKVSKGIHHTRDIIVDGLQLGFEKTKSRTADESEKVKEVVEHSTKDEKEIGLEILKKVESNLPNLGLGIGHVYNDGHASKETTTINGENAKDIGEDAKLKAKEFINSGKAFARGAYDNVKNAGDHYFHEGKDQIGESYDFVQDYYNNVGHHHGREKDYYNGPIHHHNSKGDRRFYKGARNVLSKPFYDDDASYEADGYFHNIKDKTKHVFHGASYRTKKSYNNAKDKKIGYNPHMREERGGGYISMGRQGNANGYHNVHDQGEDCHKTAKFKSGKDLGTMVESMGWRRVGIIAPDRVSISSDDEVVIGNVKYEWDIKDKHQTASTSVINSIEKDAEHNVGEKVDFGQELITKRTQNVRDIDVGINDQMHEASQALQDDRSFQVQEHPWTNHGPEHEEYEDDNINDNEDDDNIPNTRTRNQVKLRIKKGGRWRKLPRTKTNEYANLVKKNLFDFAHYDEDSKNVDKGHVLRLWKDTFIRRPQGFFLLTTRALHLFTFSIVYGSSFWVTFVSGFILSKHIPRQQFGYVQSRIFPLYLRILIAGQSVLFILYSILHPWFIADSIERWELSNFGLMIVSTIINAYVLEPQATKVMFERLKVEKEEGRGLENANSPIDAKILVEEHKKKLASINHQFKTLHNYSSALNLISLGGLTCHLWQLAHCLVI